MARLVTSGAETLDTSGLLEGVNSGSLVFSTTHVRSGAQAFMPSGTFAFPITGALATTYYARMYYYKTATPLSSAGIISILTGVAGTALALVRLEVDNTLLLRYGNTNNQGTTTVGSASQALVDNTWYRLEVAVLIGTGSIDTIEARIDGVTFASGSGLAISDTVPGNVSINPGGGISTLAWIDDVAVNDSTGSAQNSWPGDGKVVLLLPTADSARSAGWVTGAGGTTSLFSAVKNTPPVGAADPGTATSQDRNATAEANGSYDATMTTYTAAGVASGATINVVDPIIATGAPVTTSSKQGTVGVASNPAIANVALGAGGTAGAFWSGTTAGTYPTGWKISHGTITYAPSVTLGTAPVMRVTQVTSSTRIAMVCAMFMYVDYTPAAAGGDVVAPYIGGGYYP